MDHIANSKETFVVVQTDSYVEVSRRYPLWTSIPEALRAPERLWLPLRYANGGPRCPVAATKTSAGFQPCVYPVAQGATFCHSHGGPSASPRSASQVTAVALAEALAERDALAAELAALKARRPA